MIAVEPARRSPTLSFLPKPLLEPRSPLRAVVVGWLTAFLPSLLLSYLVSLLPSDVARPSFDPQAPNLFFLIVVFAPVVETLIMAAVLSVLLRLVPPAAAIVLSSLGWGIAHSLMAAAWGLVIWWPFLVFSTLYVTWRQRSLLLALAIPAATHALHNLLPSLLLLLGISG